METANENDMVLLGGSLNPPGLHHRRIAIALAERYPRIVIVPCGPRQEPEKAATRSVAAHHRTELVRLGFSGMPPNVEVDTYDLDNGVYTPTYYLQQRYEERFPDAAIWHAVGGDLVAGGAQGESEIQRSWTLGPVIWQTLAFVVITRQGYDLAPGDLPPRSRVVAVADNFGSGTIIRRLIADERPFEHLVVPAVADYIKEHRLFGYASGKT